MVTVRNRQPPPTPSELIDLENQLELDSRRSRQELAHRDARIARQIDAGRLEGAALYRAWLREARDPAAASPGVKFEQLRKLVAALLTVIGFLVGFGAMGGWLSMLDRQPINVIYLWSVLVGLQLLLLAGLVLAIAPERWARRLPGVEGLQMLARGLARALPTLTGWLAMRLLPAGRGERLGDHYGRLRKLDWQYGRIRFWLLLGLTQLFAVAFNLGLLTAFVLVAMLSDPALGWRSALLDPQHVHAAARVIALPWSWFWSEAVPLLEQVEATRYWRLEQRYLLAAPTVGTGVWAAWWPFMVASLVTYGLLPRLAFWLLARWRLNRALAGVDFGHADYQRLRERLKRPLVETESEDREEEGPPPAPGVVGGLGEANAAGGEGMLLLRWAGVELSDAEAAELVRRRLGGAPERGWAVGGLDVGNDEAALEAAAGDPGRGAIVLLVAAWEPPVGDYLDFLVELRRRIGRRPIVVLLFHRDEQGRPRAPRRLDEEQWRRRLSVAGDPGLRVDALVEEAAP